MVIGNPPYVVSSDERYRFFETYECHELYAFFFELAVSLLKPKGILSFITASLYVKGLKFESLRKFLETHLDLIEYKYQGDDIFENVSMPTSTIVGRGGNGNWACSDLHPLTKLANKLENEQKKLFQICDMQRGLEIGRSQITNIGDYQCISGTCVEKYVPHTIKFISAQTLLDNSKDEKYFTKERILLRETGSSLLAVYLDKHLYSNRSLYSIIITDNEFSTKYVLACLNSSLLQFYYSVKFKAETDLFPKIRIAQARLLPIPYASKKQQSDIEDIVNQIIRIKAENQTCDTTYLEKQIDDMLFQIYDLSQEEKTLIEQG